MTSQGAYFKQKQIKELLSAKGITASVNVVEIKPTSSLGTSSYDVVVENASDYSYNAVLKDDNAAFNYTRKLTPPRRIINKSPLK